MSHSLTVTAAEQDGDFARRLQSMLELQGFTVHISQHASDNSPAVPATTALIVLVSPDTINSESVMQDCTLARHHHVPVFPLLIRFTPQLPWYIADLTIEDVTDDFPTGFRRLLSALPALQQDITLGDARDAYLQRATLKSEHTIASYRRAIELFFEFLGDRSFPSRLPIQQTQVVTPENLPIKKLSSDDAPIFLQFAQWMLSAPVRAHSGDHRPYKPSTVELRIAGIINWFQFLDDYGWLPAQFPLAKARRIVRDELRTRPQRSGPPQPPEHMDEIIYYYDSLEPPRHLKKADTDPAKIRQWELTQLRNRALLHSLAETGGRISEVLSLNLSDFPERYLSKNDVLRVEVVGKGGHTYYLRFFDSLPAIRAYIRARGANLRATSRGEVPLFVSHASRFDGSRMSRVVAWRVVQRAARALGLKKISPHDFRHWRATQLINAGTPLDVVQDYLGHRSVETTRAYYAHTDPLRVDDAAKHTRLPKQDGESED